jgi:acetyltransferase-like isoleucine patch superfamily enzyme
LFRTKGKKVVIKDNVFIFYNCIIMPGIEIGEGSIVLAGSVVTKDVAPFSIYGGNPAVKIRERNTQINYKLYYPYMFAL